LRCSQRHDPGWKGEGEIKELLKVELKRRAVDFLES
jgi:hypothetical protein